MIFKMEIVIIFRMPVAADMIRHNSARTASDGVRSGKSAVDFHHRIIAHTGQTKKGAE